MNSIKRNYIKPTLELVDFTLSSSIASTCRLTANLAEGVCSPVIDDNGYTVYNSDYSCDYQVSLGSSTSTSDVCYHVPVADANIFTS